MEELLSRWDHRRAQTTVEQLGRRSFSHSRTIGLCELLRSIHQQRVEIHAVVVATDGVIGFTPDGCPANTRNWTSSAARSASVWSSHRPYESPAMPSNASGSAAQANRDFHYLFLLDLFLAASTSAFAFARMSLAP